MLKSSEISIHEKSWIAFEQLNCLEKLGVHVPNINMFHWKTEEDIANYLTFLNKEIIGDIIPLTRVFQYMIDIKKRKDEEALREYYTTREDFLDLINMLDIKKDSDVYDYMYNRIKSKKVCVGGGGTNGNHEFFSLMFYTIRVNDGGVLLLNFLYENGHIIDQNEEYCGFDCLLPNSISNPYDNKYRKYERFNEILNDIYMLEALHILQEQGIYLIEPKQFIQVDSNCLKNINTFWLTKDLLQPLLQKFRKQVTAAKINADPLELIKYIGEENFEELVDVINKVDFLLRKGVFSKISDFPEDPLVIEYFEQMERVKQIYINIDAYYDNNFKVTNQLKRIKED